MSSLALIGEAPVLRGLLVVLATAPLTGFLLLWPAKLLVSQFGLAQRELGRYLWVPPVCLDLGSVGLGALASRGARRHGLGHSPRGPFLIAVLLTSACAFVPFAPTPWTAIALAGAAMAGGGGLYALLTTDTLSRVAPAQTSLASGYCSSAQSLAHIVFNPLVGAVVRRRRRYHEVCVGLSVWIVPGCLAWLLWRLPSAKQEH